jgi:hypothetical protein
MTWRAISARPGGKARHARVDSSPPQGLQYTHFAEGLERRRHREEAERTKEDPWIRKRLQQVCQLSLQVPLRTSDMTFQVAFNSQI